MTSAPREVARAPGGPDVMRAARVVARGRLTCNDTPVPRLRPGASLARTLVASLCGSDLHVIDLGYAGKGRSTGFPGPPGQPGHESLVEIVDPGDGPFAVGQRCLAVPPANLSAAYAEYQVVDHASLLPLPATDRFERLVLGQQFGTVLFAFDRFWSGRLDGRTVAIVGAGSAGLLFALEARRRGAGRILVSDPSATRRGLAARAGADVTVDGAQTPFADAVLDTTAGQGADLVIEASGDDAGRADAVHALAADATLGLFGLPERRGASPFEFAELFERRARAVASHSAQREPGLQSFRDALDRIAADELDPLGLPSHRFALEAIDEAFAAARRRDDTVKVILDVGLGQ